MWVAGIDGCRGGWVNFKVDPMSLDTSVELIDISCLVCQPNQNGSRGTADSQSDSLCDVTLQKVELIGMTGLWHRG